MGHKRTAPEGTVKEHAILRNVYSLRSPLPVAPLTQTVTHIIAQPTVTTLATLLPVVAIAAVTALITSWLQFST